MLAMPVSSALAAVAQALGMPPGTRTHVPGVLMAAMELSGSWGVAFLVSAGIMAEITAKACSSPQTLEINAQMRAPTLWKWVTIGLLEGTVLVGVAAVVDRKYRAPILLGGAMELLLTWLEYLHGKRSGLRSSLPGTEHYVTNGS